MAEWAYFDTSVIVKRYVQEIESPWARKMLRRYRIVTSAIAPVEAVSALCRRRSLGELTHEDFDAIAARFRADRDYWELVEVGSEVLTRAEDLLRHAPVRTLDALHLASALLFQEEAGIGLPFVTADRKQGAAASSLNLRIVQMGDRS
ncbi:MAG: type II toxin-antitoxin system VapC family toxin [Candidatus Binataceae bacterium]